MEPGTFEIVPRVRLQRRKLLSPSDEPLPEAAVDRVRALSAKGFVAVTDLDGLGRNKADLDTLRKMAEKGNVWADAGSRFATDVMDVLVAGAERVTLRWTHIADEDELREAAEFGEPGALVLGLEYRGTLMPHPKLGGDEARIVQLAGQLGMHIVVIDEARAAAAGIDRSLATRFTGTGVERWFAGAPRDLADARGLEVQGYRGCLVDAGAAEALR